MVSQKYRWDFIGLSTDDKPTSETSDKVVNGSTYYCSDTSKLYVYCDGTWYERKPLGGGGGGTSDFNDLSNRPKYNGTDMTGSTNIPEVVTYSDFTGTDGVDAGTSGLVPAPTTSDTDKYLKSDGTWATVSGGGGSGAIELTTADYNWPETGTKDGIAFWLLGPGIYVIKETNMVEYSSRTSKSALSQNSLILMGQTEFVGNQPKYSYIVWTPDGEGYSSPYFVKIVGGSISSAKLSPTVVQTTGTSATDVMSQNAVTSMVFADPATMNNVKVGRNAGATGYYSIALGYQARAQGNNNIAIGRNANVDSTATNAVAIGEYSFANTKGQFDISALGNVASTEGYNNSAYRLLTGLYDGQSDHDAATVGQLKMGTLSASPTGTTAGFPGRLYTLDTGGGTYEVYLCVHDNGDDTYVWKQVSLI